MSQTENHMTKFQRYTIEQYSHEKRLKDGEVYRNIGFYKRSYRGADWPSMLQACKLHLTPCKRVNISSMMNEKNKEIVEKFDLLLPFPGQWDGFELGNIRKHMVAREALLNYVHHIYKTWDGMTLGIDIIRQAANVHTVRQLQLRAPSLSSADRDFVIRNMDNKSLFPSLTDCALREAVKAAILEVKGLIPSIKSLHENMNYYVIGIHIIKKHLFQKNLPQKTVYESLRKCWSAPETIWIERREGEFERVSAVDGVDLFQMAYKQLLLFTWRHFPHLSEHQPRRLPGQEPLGGTVDSSYCLELLRRAQLLGFNFKAAASPSSLPQFSFDMYPHKDLAPAGEVLGRRCGRPWIEQYEQLRTRLFLPNLSGPHKEGTYPPLLYVQADLLNAFLDPEREELCVGTWQTDDIFLVTPLESQEVQTEGVTSSLSEPQFDASPFNGAVDLGSDVPTAASDGSVHTESPRSTSHSTLSTAPSSVLSSPASSGPPLLGLRTPLYSPGMEDLSHRLSKTTVEQTTAQTMMALPVAQTAMDPNTMDPTIIDKAIINQTTIDQTTVEQTTLSETKILETTVQTTSDAMANRSEGSDKFTITPAPVHAAQANFQSSMLSQDSVSEVPTDKLSLQGEFVESWALMTRHVTVSENANESPVAFSDKSMRSICSPEIIAVDNSVRPMDSVDYPKQAFGLSTGSMSALSPEIMDSSIRSFSTSSRSALSPEVHRTGSPTDSLRSTLSPEVIAENGPLLTGFSSGSIRSTFSPEIMTIDGSRVNSPTNNIDSALNREVTASNSSPNFSPSRYIPLTLAPANRTIYSHGRFSAISDRSIFSPEVSNLISQARPGDERSSISSIRSTFSPEKSSLDSVRSQAFSTRSVLIPEVTAIVSHQELAGAKEHSTSFENFSGAIFTEDNIAEKSSNSPRIYNFLEFNGMRTSRKTTPDIDSYLQHRRGWKGLVIRNGIAKTIRFEHIAQRMSQEGDYALVKMPHVESFRSKLLFSRIFAEVSNVQRSKRPRNAYKS
jgi:hypothetical protein